MSDLDVNIDGTGESSAPEDAALQAPPSGDTDAFVPEQDPETGQFKPVPYDRFQQVNDRFRSSKTQLEQAQHNLELTQNLTEQLRTQNEQYAHLVSQMHAQGQGQPAYQPPVQQYAQESEFDPYEDPSDARLRQMQSQVEQSRSALSELRQQMESQSGEFSRYRQEQTAKGIERQITNDVTQAITAYPMANKYWIHNEMLRTGKHDQGTIRLLAKRSHENQDQSRRDWARSQGYVDPPRKLLSSGPPAQQIQDLGDDLDKIEDAIRQRFGN